MINIFSGARAAAFTLLTCSLTACVLLPNDKERFEKRVATWNLIGKSVADAEQDLRDRGFKVSRHKALSNWPDQRDYLYAQRFGEIPPCLLGHREWRVVPKIENE